MYEKTPDLRRLRQGDIISSAFLPRFSNANTLFLHEYSKARNWEFKKKAIIVMNQGYAVVLSQCCEFNLNKRQAFSLIDILPWKKHSKEVSKKKSWGFNIAEFIPISKSPFRKQNREQEEELERLRRANIMSPEKKVGALSTFLFEPDGKYLTEPYVADFSRVTSLPMKDVNTILDSKILQLDSKHRRQFQTKLVHFYGRKAE